MRVPHPFLLLERVGMPKCGLRSLQNGLLYRLWKADTHKVICGVEVIFARFVIHRSHPERLSAARDLACSGKKLTGAREMLRR
jgi:hypothetical protein